MARYAQMLLDERYVPRTIQRQVCKTLNMSSERCGWELSPVHSMIKANSMHSAKHRWVTRRRQAALDAPLGFLHLFRSDILRLLRHVRLVLRCVGAMTNGHTHSYLHSREGC